ncbi:hypothetical protein A1Q2_06782 [Trichosporon asahii var. asahii CBS 8904]|uniref:Uncharacterized protein n=2 Tax=Trichosporon asahii var. asahii TaxID=189963 RepID=K1WBG8_TRIAC|nr:hypothetical protein A1Q1_00957 [Trichosporon asahii var. asahii CBS 2479]EJT49944.1 hypothetical protein A1Q1_00957 [Trichosporon asahii var. asahii CBS 2479]EKC99028.1 hypothetical protein A1Q2_06782 [Trichosporon asahii var. asahii CBS 8904]
MPPAEIHPDRTYIHVTTNDPKAIAKSPSPGVGLEYRGPVGELDGEHVFEVTSADGYLAPDSRQWKREGPELLKEVKAIPGVQDVQPLTAKPRAKRDEL